MGSSRSVDCRRFALACALAATALVVVAVIVSNDFEHPDEHFQTIEFAGYLLGRTPQEALPWEFEARMRPWLQPAVYAVVARALGTLASPFTWTAVLRAISALLTLAANATLTLAIWKSVEDGRARKIAVFTLWLGFWVPYLAVRTSSETTAGAFIGLALGALVLELARPGAPRRNALVAIGFLFGLAFELRYQTGIMALGVVLWFWGPGRTGRRIDGWVRSSSLIAGMLAAVALGTLVDRACYGAWTYAPYNYFRENLVKGAAAEFGTSPPFAYLWTAHDAPTAVVTVTLVALVAIGWVRGRRHVTTWASVPFFLVHGLLAHKETRFLFPLLGISALQVGFALDGGTLADLRRTLVGRFLASVVAVANIAALVSAPFVLRFPMVDCERFLAERAGAPAGAAPRAILVDDPYDYGGELFIYALRSPKLALERVREPQTLAEAMAKPGRAYVVAKQPASPEIARMIGDAKVAYRTPAWRARLGAAMGSPRAAERWIVFER